MNDCIFCKIAEGAIPSSKAYEDERVLAFHDIDPQAPVHVLIVPRRHIESVDTLAESDADILFRLFEVARLLAAKLGLSEKGYRIVTNVGRDGGQSVPHLHLHLLGGRSLQWPPG